MTFFYIKKARDMCISYANFFLTKSKRLTFSARRTKCEFSAFEGDFFNGIS